MKLKTWKPWKSFNKKGLTAAIALTLCSSSVAPVHALPQFSGIVSEQGSVDKPTTDETGKIMTITQHADRAALDWTAFDIGTDEKVIFEQKASDIALNRVIENNPSKILGALTANGQVFLFNPSGITFGSTARIDVGALVASTATISQTDAKAWAATANAPLKASIAADSTAAITNSGVIKAIKNEGGMVVLHAANITNETGASIQAAKGVELKAVQTMEYASDGKISFGVDSSELAKADILNKGSIAANNGYIALTARGANGVVSTVVNNANGKLEATGISRDEEGNPVLSASGGKIVMDAGDSGRVEVRGKINASGTQGGSIELDGATVKVAKETKELTAASTESDTNGSLTIQSLNTIKVEKSAPNASYVDSGVLKTTLKDTDVTITAHNAKQNVSDIVVNAEIGKDGDAETTLTLNADRNVTFNEGIQTDGKLNVTTQAGSDITLIDGVNDKFGANIVTSDIKTKGNVTLGGNSYIGLSTSEITAAGLDQIDSDTSNPNFGKTKDKVVRTIEGNNIKLDGDVQLAIGHDEGDRWWEKGHDTAIGVTLNAAGDVELTGTVDSGNVYTYKSTKTDHATAVNNYEYYHKDGNGNRPGTKDGDTYLATITSGLEDSVVASKLPAGNTESFIGGEAEKWDDSTGTRVWKWTSGPEKGQTFFVQTHAKNNRHGTKNYKEDEVSGTVANGMYANFCAGEPNSESSEKDDQPYLAVSYSDTTRGVQDNNTSRWDDYFTGNKDSQKIGSIVETNLKYSSLEIHAGGNVKFDKAVGSQKKLNNLSVLAKGNIEADSTILTEGDHIYIRSENGNINMHAKVENECNSITLKADNGSVHAEGDVRSRYQTALYGKTGVQADKLLYGHQGVTAESSEGDVTVNEVSNVWRTIKLEAAEGTVTVNGEVKSKETRNDDNQILVTAGKEVILQEGAQLNSNAAGKNAAVVIKTDGKFTNLAGDKAVTTGAGSTWNIYSDSPEQDTFGGLDSGNLAYWNSSVMNYSAGFTGNRYIFAKQPTLTVRINDVSKVYGTVGTDAGYTISNSEAGDAYKNAFLDGQYGTADSYKGYGLWYTDKTVELDSTGFPATAAAGSYAVDVHDNSLNGSVTSYGYNIDVKAGTLTVNEPPATPEPEPQPQPQPQLRRVAPPIIPAPAAEESADSTSPNGGEKPDMFLKATTNADGTAGYNVNNGRNGIAGVDRVAGLQDAQFPFFRIAEGKKQFYGAFEVAADPDKVKLTPSDKVLPEPPEVHNQYREYEKSLTTEKGDSAVFKLTYNGSKFQIMPTDEAGREILRAGDSDKNADIASKALLAAFNEMGITLEDLDTIYVHIDGSTFQSIDGSKS